MVYWVYFVAAVERGRCLRPVDPTASRVDVGRCRLSPSPCWRHLGAVAVCQTRTFEPAVAAAVVWHASVADLKPRTVTHLSCSVASHDTDGGRCRVLASNSVARRVRLESLSSEGPWTSLPPRLRTATVVWPFGGGNPDGWQTEWVHLRWRADRCPSSVFPECLVVQRWSRVWGWPLSTPSNWRSRLQENGWNRPWRPEVARRSAVVPENRLIAFSTERLVVESIWSALAWSVC